MDYKELAEMCRYLSDTPSYTAFHDQVERECICDSCKGGFCYEKVNDAHWCMYEALQRAATAITELLARAEAAEADRDRLREAMKPNCLMCDSMHENGNCTEVGGFCTAVPAAHCPLIPRLQKKLAEAEARAEKAEQALKERKNAGLYDMPPMGGFHDD